MSLSRREPRLAACVCFSFAALAGVALQACSPSSNASKDEAFAGVRKREAARVMVEPVVRREMVRRLETTTRVESESHVTFYPRASGVLSELFVEEGDVVSAGHLLARLDDRDAKLRLADARAVLHDAESNGPSLALGAQESQSRADAAKRTADQAARDHERNLAISQGVGDTPGLISSKDLDASLLAKDRAWADYETAKLGAERAKVDQTNGANAIERAKVALERSELELSHTRLTVDVAGVIAERSIKVGDTISTATPAFVITDPARLRAVFHRPQRELGMFLATTNTARGPDARFAELEIIAKAEALPDLHFKGRILRIAPTIDAASGNFRVTARLEPASIEDPSARLLPGMLVRLEIVTERHPDALVVPKRAIRREGDRSTIFVVEDGKVRRVEIDELFTDDLAAELAPLGGAVLEAGMQVVVVGNRDLDDGAEVQITASENAALPAAANDPAASADKK